ncbi:hypothetical protein N7530_010740 [Penicillium desertorum]|uniref:RNase H type-1 domain-containing protein n=1 Tax=Penicillium desertorum TaxID=1303715 RepID=A0A9X0BGZ0_9EURO|nr:hypothetical protein N7530_010740 [Penicillium desertorum]
MNRTGLLQQFQYVALEDDDDDEPTGLAAMDLGVEDDGAVLEGTKDMIFTDGSGFAGHIGASMASLLHGVRSQRKYLGTDSQSTVYAAELSGIEMALAQAKEENEGQNEIGQQQAREVIIFSDSQAAIQAVQNPQRPSGQYVLALIYNHVRAIRSQTQGPTNITIRWIPAHVGVDGNEFADEEAKGAALLVASPVYPCTTGRTIGAPKTKGPEQGIHIIVDYNAKQGIPRKGDTGQQWQNPEEKKDRPSSALTQKDTNTPITARETTRAPGKENTIFSHTTPTLSRTQAPRGRNKRTIDSQICLDTGTTPDINFTKRTTIPYPMSNTPLTIVQYNTNRSRDIVMADFLAKPGVYQADIIAIQEPWENPYSDTTYHPLKQTHELLYPSTKTGGRARVCIYISKRIGSEWTHHAHSAFCQEVRMQTVTCTVRIFNIYNECGTTDTIDLLHQTIRGDGHVHSIVLGDFNLHHPA